MRKYSLKRTIVKGGAGAGAAQGQTQDVEKGKGSRAPSVTPSTHVSRAAEVPLPVTPTQSISRSDRSQERSAASP